LDQLDGYFTPTQVAEMFDVSIASVRGWCRAKSIDCLRIGRNYFIPKAAIEACIHPPRPTNLYTKPYLTITEAAQMLQLPRYTLEAWCIRGKVPTVRRGRRHEISQRTLDALRDELAERYQA
jgi:excisionase family DNA binding protein